MNRTTILASLLAFVLAVSVPLITSGTALFPPAVAAPAQTAVVTVPVKASNGFVPAWSPDTVSEARKADRLAAQQAKAAAEQAAAEQAAAEQAAAEQAAAQAASGGSWSAGASGSTAAGSSSGGQAAAPAAPACPAAAGGGPAGAPGRISGDGVAGTNSGDLASFASAYNAIRVANCLAPIPPSNIRFDSCLEDRLFWIAGDPSTDVASAWGHAGTVSRSDGVPEYGCDGNLAGGSNNSGATVAQKWWDSPSHRASLYRPGNSIAGICIAFALVHGGVNDPGNFARASAKWVRC